MDKIRVNLLPKEILEKRKVERLLTLMILGVLVVAVLMVSIYGLNFVRIMREQTKLDMLKADNEQYQREITKIEDFEKNKMLVEERERLVNSAIAGKYSWSRLLNNISLIVPNEVWLSEMKADKTGALTFSGSALADKSMARMGQKAVAKWLVHLSEMDDISDVWLASSAKSTGPADASAGPAAPETADTTDAPEYMQFQTTAKIKSLQVGSPGAPAPPGTGGKT